MSLAVGTRFGSYEIVARAGAGGMGEVFRAVDVNLGRTAAIKVLPASLASDPDRLARFEREAHTLALLNHPNIAQVFGFEKGEGHFRALAMEFVEGPTLAERIDGGPLPIDESIAIAIQIAEALESAHDHGIVHRDLKPLNIKVRPDGTVKVLDFGLAKELHPASELPIGSMANSPTITTPAMTHLGIVLGTASYMSPEQAKGRVIDRRTDIWAFGCVLFEMLTGNRAFGGPDVSDVLVSILRDEPKWSSLPASTPPHVRSLLRRCLEKDVRKRLPHIGVARLELAELPADAPDSTAVDRLRVRWRVALAVSAVLAVALAAASWTIWSRRTSSAGASPVRVQIDLGTTTPIALTGTSALSPDGKILAFTGRPVAANLGSSLYVRHLDRLDAEMLAGTDGALAPFFSPDGRWIAFFAENTLKKIATSGGPITSLCAASLATGGWWEDDDAIVFGTPDGLSRVTASGGAPALIAKVAPGQPIPAAPQVLPRGRGVLYSQAANSDPATGALMIQDFGGGAAKEVLRSGGRFPRYLASGHLTFVRSGTLFAVPFDLDTGQARGEPLPVVDNVVQSPTAAFANLAIATNGMLAFESGTSGQTQQASIGWLTPTGATLRPLRATPATFVFPRFSPDGKQLAMSISDGRQFDVWVYDWERDILTRITSDPGLDLAPVWTPDGTGLIFGSTRGSAALNLFWQRADGTGSAERLTTSAAPQLPDSIDPDGTLLVFHEGDPGTGRQLLGVLPLQRGENHSIRAGLPRTLIGGPFLKPSARISPDGKWISYATNESGVFQIYVQPFPSLGERVQVSSEFGSLAVWSRTKNELYFVATTSTRLMAVAYSVVGGKFVPAKPRPWSETTFSAAPPVRTYGPGLDIHPDGERFAVTPPQPTANMARAAQMVLLFNFFDELRRVAPVK